MRLDARLRQHGALALAHFALFVRRGVVVAEEVEDAVRQQVRHLGVEVVTGFRRLPLGRFERDDDVAEVAELTGRRDELLALLLREREDVGWLVLSGVAAVEGVDLGVGGDCDAELAVADFFVLKRDTGDACELVRLNAAGEVGLD